MADPIDPGVVLDAEEVETLRARFHEMRMGRCPHPDLVPAPCEDLADWLEPAVARIVADRERKVRESAWDEGARRGHTLYDTRFEYVERENPYRIEEGGR